jgi:hypothetical protein
MPNLHWYCYSFLEKIFNHMADFATDYGNVNVVSEGCPISELNIQPIVKAARTMKAFEDKHHPPSVIGHPNCHFAIFD